MSKQPQKTFAPHQAKTGEFFLGARGKVLPRAAGVCVCVGAGRDERKNEERKEE